MASASTPRFRLVELTALDPLEEFPGDVAAGLTAEPKRLSCRYFYDREGSRLFEAICELPEYYLTRAETEILERHAREIASLFPNDVTVIELGSGSAVKTRLLLQALAEQGDVAAAMITYRAFRLRLHEELAAQPSPETTALYQQIRAQICHRTPTPGAPPSRHGSGPRRCPPDSGHSRGREALPSGT